MLKEWRPDLMTVVIIVAWWFIFYAITDYHCRNWNAQTTKIEVSK